MKASAITVYPSSISGKLTPPSSKSVLHRAIIASALAKGTSRIFCRNAQSADVMATLEAVKLLGAKTEVTKEEIIIEGTGANFKNEPHTVSCGESGSTLRFLIPIFSLTGNETSFKGSKTLLSRPLDTYASLFMGKNMTLNLTPASVFLHGKLTPGNFVVKGDISSQFITGLLFALPLLGENSTIKILPPFESRSYVLLTLNLLKEFGVNASFVDDNTISVAGNQTYSPCSVSAEGDYSQLAFFGALAAVKGEISAFGMNKSSVQGDRVILDILRRFGAEVGEDRIGITVKASTLNGCEINLADCPDLGPVLMALAAFAKGKTTITNASRLRIKESDRIAAMQTELTKLGVSMEVLGDSVIIHGRTPLTAPVTVDSHNDHRILMSLAVFAACAEQPVTLEGAECVNKSYPSFFDDLKEIGIKFLEK